MFRFDVAADHLPVFQLEQVLERCGWTDLIHVVVDGAEVYRDDEGLAADLVPVLDVVRDTLLDRFTPFEVALGRREGDFEVVTILRSDRFRVAWMESVRDLGLDRDVEETPEAHRERLKALLASGYLAQVSEVLIAGFEQHLQCVADHGLVFRPGTVRGPWLQLRGEDWAPELSDLHARFGTVPPLATDRLLLHLLLEDPGAPTMDVRVDHYGEDLSLTDLRDVLTALATPPPDLATDA